MRRGIWTRLLLLAFLQFGLREQLSWAGPKAPGGPKAVPVVMTKLLPPIEAEGKHINAEGARENALDDARDKILAILEHQSPSLRWPGMEEYVNEHIRNKSWQVEDLPSLEVISNSPQKLVIARVRVEMKLTDYQEMLALDRQYRAEHRQIWLARLLPGLVIILAGVAGFCRVRRVPRDSSAVKGSAKLISVAVLAALAVGLFLFLARSRAVDAHIDDSTPATPVIPNDH